MLQELIKMAKEVQALTPDELNKEVQATRNDMEQEESIQGKPSLPTNLRAHVLTMKMLGLL